MLELLTPSQATAHGVPAMRDYRGPERRSPGLWRWLTAMLDEVDYGMLLVVQQSLVMHANHVARAEMDAAHPLQIVGAELRARRPQDVAPLFEAITLAARKGLRKLLTLNEGAQRLSVAIVPLGGSGMAEGGATLLMFGRRQVCEDLSAQSFALAHGLTPAETAVLKGLCAGECPTDIARRQGVAISTVRTQISSIRGKTGADSIRELVRQVATLPPLVSALGRARPL